MTSLGPAGAIDTTVLIVSSDVRKILVGDATGRSLLLVLVLVDGMGTRTSAADNKKRNNNDDNNNSRL